MFFVVFSHEEKKYYIVPKNWIQDLRFECIVNYLLNTSFKYRCYCANEPNAFIDGAAIVDFIPDFSMADGFYLASLVKYFGKCEIILVFFPCYLLLNIYFRQYKRRRKVLFGTS